MTVYTPQTIHFKDEKSYQDFIEKKEPEIFDEFVSLLKEHYFVYKPDIYFQPEEPQNILWESFLKENPQYIREKECFVYHSWNNKLFHLLNNGEFLSLRTVRHRNIITQEDQEKLYNKTIAIAGLSVGSNILLSFIRYGMGSRYHIADSDTVSLSNINRAFYGITQLGQKKTTVMRDAVHNIDPFISLRVFEQGISEEKLDEFLHGVDLIVDAFDQFALKIQLRKKAKELHIPVLSGFDIEKGAMVIIERYDTEDIGLEVFLNNYKEHHLYEQKTVEDKTNMFINIIGREYHSGAMLDSVLSVGKQLTGYPQLIIATSLAASLFTTAAEQILLGKNLSSKRVHISLPDFLV